MNLKQQIKKAAFVAPACAVAVLLTVSACNGLNGFKKTPSGLEYKILTKGSGARAKIGDFIQLHIIETVHDSTVFDSYKQGPSGPMWQEIQTPNGQHYDLMEGFAVLAKGDSAEFVVPADSVLNVLNRPPFIKKGDKLKFFVKVLDVKDSQQYKSALVLEEKAEAAKEDSIIQVYMNTNHLTATKTPEGVYVITQQPGSGSQPQNGQEVTMMYTGKTLEGQIFDSNEDSAFHHTQPLI
ncbi:MAG: FKBP-type peptidyl-prolyl cis-trans isomerase, partial [Chitinophagaceae bacterium]